MTRSYRRKPAQGTMFLIAEGFATIFTSFMPARQSDAHHETMPHDNALSGADSGRMRRRMGR